MTDAPPSLDERLLALGASWLRRLVSWLRSDRKSLSTLRKLTTVAGRGFQKRATIEAVPLGSILTPGEIKLAQIIKIDVEGAEVAVLDGMIPLLDSLAQDVEILLELSPAWWPDKSRTPDEVLEPFFKAGFQAYTLSNDYWPWRYLWPNCVEPPRPVTQPLPADVKRIDLLLTRK